MSKLTTGTKTINISLPVKLVNKLDKAANDQYATRSDFIRESILQKLNEAEDRWETVADLTKAKKGGVDIDDLIKRL